MHGQKLHHKKENKEKDARQWRLNKTTSLIKDCIKWSKKPNTIPTILNVPEFKDKLIEALNHCIYL